MEVQTQRFKILAYIKEHGEITQRDAIRLGCYRLGARIYDLRRAGYDVVSRLKAVPRADGTSAHIAVYSLRKEEKEDAEIRDDGQASDHRLSTES